MSTKAKLFLTGITGTLGKAFMAKYSSTYDIIGFSRDEFKQYELKKIYKNVRFVIGDIRDYERVEEAMKGCTKVIHAAALKHVTMGESQPEEFIKTNIQGTMNVVRAAKRLGIKQLVFTSTDKAVEPINLYGATKLCAEKIVISNGYTVVRYGNVFGSRGSVVPHFLASKKNGVLRVSDPEVTRFSITIDEACEMVNDGLTWSNALLIPNLKSYTLKDVAKAICPDCKIEVYGLESGEKKHEKLDDGYTSFTALRLTIQELKKLIHDSL